VSGVGTGSFVLLQGEIYSLFFFDGLQNRAIKTSIVTADIAVSIDGAQLPIWFPA